MRSILILLLFAIPCFGQTFGLGNPEPLPVSAPTLGGTFGLNGATTNPIVPITKAVVVKPRLETPLAANGVVAPVYETVNVTTGYETICENGICRRIPIVQGVRRLVVNTSTPLQFAAATVDGPPPPGFHDHTDSAGNTWRHEDWNNGSTSAHISPMTGELVLDRSADSSVGRVRFAPLRGIRARFSLRR